MHNLKRVLGDLDAVLRLIRLAETSINGGFLFIYLPGRETIWSRGLFNLLEIDFEEKPAADEFNKYIHPDDRRPISEIEAARGTGIPYERTVRIITGKKSLKWVCLHNEFVLNDKGETACHITVVSDVTDKQQYKMAAEIHRLRNVVLIESFGSITWTARKDGYIDRLTGWENLTGQPDHESEGWGWLSYVHPEDTRAVTDLWERNLEEGAIHEATCRVRKKDGTWAWLATKALPIKDSSNTIIEWVGSARNIQSEREWSVDPDDSLYVTGAQLRAARGILNWSVSKLADASQVPISSIRRIEEYDGLTRASGDTLRKLKKTLQEGGVEFIFPPNGRPGARPSQ